VQIAVSDEALVDRDLLVSAQTGSGKTVGFGLAIAPTLLDGEQFEEARTPLALVIAPTRELALQVKRELAWLYAKAGVRMASCVGGMDMRDERRALERGAHIVVATPGRLVDHINRRSIDLSGIRAVVLDEADEMLRMGFIDDVETILSKTPDNCQRALFSATMPPAIRRVSQKYLGDAETVNIQNKTKTVERIEQQYVTCKSHQKMDALTRVLEVEAFDGMIIFVRTKSSTVDIAERL
jgi:ATP-dependent RNA helicase DeaD